mmetsp:Transcript_2430/g.7534  ORF Transcript_2430/g.7534 Transcript_2430/m.7534 type:complete len:229 (-) Transcript_2430:186-872(-)
MAAALDTALGGSPSMRPAAMAAAFEIAMAAAFGVVAGASPAAEAALSSHVPPVPLSSQWPAAVPVLPAWRGDLDRSGALCWFQLPWPPQSDFQSFQSRPSFQSPQSPLPVPGPPLDVRAAAFARAASSSSFTSSFHSSSSSIGAFQSYPSPESAAATSSTRFRLFFSGSCWTSHPFSPNQGWPDRACARLAFSSRPSPRIESASETKVCTFFIISSGVDDGPSPSCNS